MFVPWRIRVSRKIRGYLRSLTLSKSGIGVVADTQNGVLIVDPRDFGVSSSLLKWGAYDWTSVAWLLPLLNQESRIVFAGAHLGALLVPIALRSGSREIVAFEPAPRNHRLLQLNLALNGLTNVLVQQCAVGDCEGSLRFTQNAINTGNSRVSQAGEVVVPVTTLDAALPPANWPHTDLLVMDTEGFEVHAMRGAQHFLEQTRYFYVEYAPEQLAEQGSSTQQFLELAAGRFESMYLQGREPKFFASRSYLQYLKEVPPRRGLLLNLLFSNEARPNPQLLASSP
jgi:FkbM family methyltransferase